MPPTYDPCMWLHPVTPARDFWSTQLHLRSWVDWAAFHGFAKSATSLERQRSVLLARDVSCDFFRSRWASPSINLVCLLGWLFYNFKSSKPNGSASLCGKRSRKLLIVLLGTLSELLTPPLQWPELVLDKLLVQTPHQSSASLMSPLNKPQELHLITVTLALSLLFPLALTASVAHHCSRELFTEFKKLKELNKLQPISNDKLKRYRIG